MDYLFSYIKIPSATARYITEVLVYRGLYVVLKHTQKARKSAFVILNMYFNIYFHILLFNILIKILLKGCNVAIQTETMQKRTQDTETVGTVH